MAFSSSTVVCCVVAVVVAMAAGQSDKCQMNGQSYDVGSMFDGPDAFYYCKRDGSGTKAEAIGCVNNGQRVYDLALYQKGDNFFRCRAGDTSVTSELWGCAVKGADGSITPKSIACTWDASMDPISYVQCCVAKGGTAVIQQLYCLYTYRGGRIQVNQGCYRVFPDDKVAAGCSANPDGNTLTLKTWPAKNSAEAAANAQASGMTECPFSK